MGRTQRNREGGATLVEFAFVSMLLFLLIFGIISFGVLLSFKQTVTEAANEGARDAAVIEDDAATPTIDERRDAAEDAVNSFEAWGRDCGDPNMHCDIKIHDCGQPVTTNDPALAPDCITVRLTYDYGDDPIVPNAPIIDAFMPDSVESTATAQLTFPGVGP